MQIESIVFDILMQFFRFTWGQLGCINDWENFVMCSESICWAWPIVSIVSLQASENGLYGKRPVWRHALVALLTESSHRSSLSIQRNSLQPLRIFVLKYGIVGTSIVHWCFLHDCLIAQWNLLFTPASFGCDQMLVWLARKNGNTLLSMRNLRAFLFQWLPWPSRNKMTGPCPQGKLDTKCIAYTKNTSCVMLPLPVVCMTTSGMSSNPSVQWLAVIVSVGISPLCCLKHFCASFSLVFDLSAWIISGPQAPSVILLATSW